MADINLLVLIGSIKGQSSNHKLIRFLEKEYADKDVKINWEIFPIAELPFFNPDLDKTPQASINTGPALPSNENPLPNKLPPIVEAFRKKLGAAGSIMICTPEYVFSLPGVLKNALEWLVSTTVLSNKQVALITAAASGEKAKQVLELIIRTLGGIVPEECSILIQGIAGKFNQQGELADPITIAALHQFMDNFIQWTCESLSASPEL